MSEKKPEMHAFKVIMSRGDALQIDGDEVNKIIGAIQTGNPCKVRQGIFNPSFYVSIVQDSERVSAFRRELNQVIEHNRQDREYHGNQNQKPLPAARSLKDIFEGVPLKLPTQNPRNQLGGPDQ